MGYAMIRLKLTDDDIILVNVNFIVTVGVSKQGKTKVETTTARYLVDNPIQEVAAMIAKAGGVK
jgi:hypothetical protein